MKLSHWIDIEHCSMRVLEGTDPAGVANRVAFIEKHPRVRIAPWSGDLLTDSPNWQFGPRGHAPEYGSYQPSRDWCDAELVKMGYELPDPNNPVDSFGATVA